MAFYLATLKNGDQIRTAAANQAEARVKIRDVYHVRESAFSLALEGPAPTREDFLKLLHQLEQAGGLLNRYRDVVDLDQLASLNEENRQFVESTGVGQVREVDAT